MPLNQAAVDQMESSEIEMAIEEAGAALKGATGPLPVWAFSVPSDDPAITFVFGLATGWRLHERQQQRDRAAVEAVTGGDDGTVGGGHHG